VKRILSIAAGVALAAALQTGAAHAQMNQLMRHNVNNDATNVFGCGTACTSGGPEQRCNVFKRVWADLKPSQINLVAAPITACEKDGFPRYATVPLRLVGDVYTSQNFSDSNNNANACEAWMSAWDATLSPATGTFISFYGIGSGLINFGEVGNGFCSNCLRNTDTGYATTCNTVDVAANLTGLCFGAMGIIGQAASPAAGGVVAGGTTAADNSVNTPLGNDADADGSLDTRGGLEPVPVPRVTSSNVIGRAVTVAWDAADNQNLTNRPGVTAVPCPGASTFPNEQSTTTSPAGIASMRLFVHRRAAGAVGKTLAELEGTAVTGGVLDAFGNTAVTGYCNTDGGGEIIGTACPGSHIVACNSPGVTGGVCAANGIDFAPASQSVTLTEAAVNAALGVDGPLGSGDVGVLNTKVVYMGSTQAHSSGGNGFLNPKLVSLFSASSSAFSFGGLATGVQFDSSATVVRGNRVTLSWTAVGGPFSSFALSRALNGVDFEPVATIPGSAQPTYTFTDEIQGRASASIWYRIVYTDVSGIEGQALTEVNLRTGGRR